MTSLQKLTVFLKPYAAAAILAPLMMVGEVALDLQQPRLMKQIIDEGVAKSDQNFVIHHGLLMILFALAGVFFGTACGWFAVRASQGIGYDLRQTLFRKVQALSFADLDRLQIGNLITRFTNDISQVQEFVSILLRMMVRIPLLMIGGLTMAIITSFRLSWIFAVLLPLAAIGMTLVIRKTYPIYHRVQDRLDQLNTVLQENLAGIRVVKIFARSRYESGRFENANEFLMNENIAAVRISAITMPMMGVILNLGTASVLWFGGLQNVVGKMQVGEIIAFINYLTFSLYALMMSSMLVMRFSRAEASAERLQEALNSEPAIAKVEAEFDRKMAGRVVCENVTFRYPGTHEDALTNINFSVEPGETIAIIGATGSGKTTLALLLARLYDVTSGGIFIDGTDVRKWDENALRRGIGIALQETLIFSGTIRDNLKYSRPDASDEEMMEAAEAAQARKFIESFPEGYETILGQRGVNLSGGQKQRIAIARLILANPSILIFDDSTSAVDVTTEKRILAALDLRHKRQTRFIIAQRISTVLSADKILVLEKDRLAGQGTHSELMLSCKVYREIYESQMEAGTVDHSTE